MKEFKNTFAVTGTHKQLIAFAEWAASIGWAYQHRDGCEEHEILYFSTGERANYPKNSCWLAISALVKVFTLPAQWAEAMKHASEVEEVRFEVDKKYILDGGTVVYCTGMSPYKDCFSGIVIKKDKYNRLFETSDRWDKSSFTPYNEPVTI
jgi:hypothetical protein